MITPGKLPINILLLFHFFLILNVLFTVYVLYFSATGDPDTPISEGEDELGSTQGGNG